MAKKLLYPFLLCLLLTSALPAAALVPGGVSQIQSSQCGTTLSSLSTNISATQVSGASAYRFRVTSTGSSGQDQVIERPTRTFKLTQLATYNFATTYYIQVSIRVQGVWQAYGPQCSVTSPSPRTKIQNSQCGSTLTSISNIVYCNSVSLSSGYRFRITNVTNPLEVLTIDRPLREFRFNLLPSVTSGATYAVEVAVKNFDGSYLPYGEPCSITMPVIFTKINESQCGSVLGAMSDDVFANSVNNVQGYRFRITRLAGGSDVQVVNKLLRTFRMKDLNNIQYNTPYRIEVAIKDPHGDYLAYGPPCTVITPGLPIPKIQLSQCELVASNASDLIYADEYPNATTYRFKLENTQLGYSQYIDRAARNYSLNMLPGLQPSTTYTVRVAVKVNGSFTPFGKACDVTTPGSMSRIADENENTSNDASAFVYPNPFSNAFRIDTKFSPDAPVVLKVYDMTGRVLDELQGSARDLATFDIGQNYPPGIYNIALTCDGRTQTRRAVKK